MAQITVPQSEAFISYSGVASAPAGTPFAINFPFFAFTDIAVTIQFEDGSVDALVYGADYTVSGVPADDGYSSGSATLAVGLGATVSKLTVWRNTPIEKLSNWPTTGAFSIYAENTLWSKHTAWHQQHARDFKRAILAPPGEKLKALPAKELRANKALGFDAQGNPIATALSIDDIISYVDAAAASAAAAAVSEGNAAGSASAASGSASAAAGSAAAASSSAGAAAASAAAAAASAAAVGQPATEVVAGIAEVATTAEMNTGTDDTRMVTPKKMVDYLVAHPGAVSSASETVQGIAELATTAEVTAGTDDLRIVTPLKLAQGYVGKSGAQSMQGPLTVSAGAMTLSLAADNYAGMNISNSLRNWFIGVAQTTGELWIKDNTANQTRLKITSTGAANFQSDLSAGADGNFKMWSDGGNLRYFQWGTGAHWQFNYANGFTHLYLGGVERIAVGPTAIFFNGSTVQPIDGQSRLCVRQYNSASRPAPGTVTDGTLLYVPDSGVGPLQIKHGGQYYAFSPVSAP